MSYNFGIRLGSKNNPFALELLPQCVGVHDDSVVNDADALLRVEVGVGVLVGLAAVRRPARVGDAHVVAGMFFCVGAYQCDGVRGTAFARVFGYGEFIGASLQSSHARAIVASVLEDGEAVEQDVSRVVPLADDAHNAAVLGLFLEVAHA